MTKTKTFSGLLFGLFLLAAAAVALLMTNTAFAAVSRTNSGFETGNLTGWNTSGSISVQSTWSGYSAPYGNNFALLSSAGCAGANLSQNFSGLSGDIVSGQAAFKTTDYLPYNDYGQLRILQGNVVLFYKNVASVGNYGQTPWTAWSYTLPADGTYTIQGTAKNVGDCGVSSYLLLDSPQNTAPTLDSDTDPVITDEGETAVNTGTVSDPDGDFVTLSASAGTVTNNNDGTWSWSLDTNDGPAESQTVTISGDDGFGGLSDTEFELTVNNVAPTLGALTVPTEPISINDQPVTGFTASFVDPGTVDTHMCHFDYNDDGSIDESVAAVGLTCEGSHTYPEAGVYTVSLTVEDNDGGMSNESIGETLVVIYDPTGGFVTGGGWIHSPEGAFKADESLTGKANFGFVSKYKKGASVPTGNTEFQFKAGDLNFHSSTYEWLVVNQGGSNAQFKGEGTINGSGTYNFMLWAGDGSPDTFRIMITEQGGGTVYDNGFDQTIGGGQIVIHTKN